MQLGNGIYYSVVWVGTAVPTQTTGAQHTRM